MSNAAKPTSIGSQFQQIDDRFYQRGFFVAGFAVLEPTHQFFTGTSTRNSRPFGIRSN
jgi:hypothetical protein